MDNKERIDQFEQKHLADTIREARIAALPYESFSKFLTEKYSLSQGDQINPDTGKIIRHQPFALDSQVNFKE